MRIAVVTSSYPANDGDPSGHFVETELYRLIEAGHEVTLLAPRATTPRAQQSLTLHELPHGGLFGWPGALVRLKRSPWRLVGLPPFVIAARRALQAHGPFDQIVAHWLVPGFWPICRDFGICTHVVTHGSDVGLLEHAPAPLQRRILRALCRDPVRLRCVSQDLAARLERLAARHGLQLGAIRVEPAAIDIPTLAPRATLRRELSLPATPIVVIVGRAVKTKQIDKAIIAIRTATETASGLAATRILVIGDGPELTSLQNRFVDVQWLGQLSRTETLRHIRAADLLVSASRAEGAPTVIREAIALGTPIVAAKAGDLEILAMQEPLLDVCEPFDASPAGSACTQIVQRLTAALNARRAMG